MNILRLDRQHFPVLVFRCFCNFVDHYDRLELRRLAEQKHIPEKKLISKYISSRLENNSSTNVSELNDDLYIPKEYLVSYFSQNLTRFRITISLYVFKTCIDSLGFCHFVKKRKKYDQKEWI